MEIKVYGPGCARCKKTLEAVRWAVETGHVDATIDRIEDLGEMAKAGVLQTPAVSIDGVIRIKGRVPSVEDVRKLLDELAPK